MKHFTLSILLLTLMISSSSAVSITDTLIKKRVDTIIMINPQTMEEEMIIDRSWDPKSKDKVIHTGRFYGRDSLGIYTFPSKNPEFPGGDSGLIEHIKKNLRYPEAERKNKMLKTVLTRFVINPDGSVRSPKVIHGASPAFDEEAIRVLKTLPKFIPGKQEGKPVPVYFNLPIHFVPVLVDTEAVAGEGCQILLNGKRITRGTSVAKEDVAKLCEMIFIGPKGNMKPSYFNWVISSKGTIWKGNYPSADACSKLKNLTSRLQKGDIIFIESIGFLVITGLCQEQFYLKVE